MQFGRADVPPANSSVELTRNVFNLRKFWHLERIDGSHPGIVRDRGFLAENCAVADHNIAADITAPPNYRVSDLGAGGDAGVRPDHRSVDHSFFVDMHARPDS